MNPKIKIAIIVQHLKITGISQIIMNYIEKIDLKKFEITIFTGLPYNYNYFQMCKKIGINVIKLPNKTTNRLNYYYNLFKKIKYNSYDIAHIHGNSTFMLAELLISKLRGIKIRIAHCHAAHRKNNIQKFISPLFQKSYTKAIACSSSAGLNTFKNNDFIVLNNSFDISKFLFNSQIRTKLRKKLKIENNFIIGHVGRFNIFKNHEYILKVFDAIATKIPESKLLLIGDGPDYQKIKLLAKKSKNYEKIIFYGESININELYSVMDIFIFPSKEEGLGMSLIEAQINGLNCLASNNVPKEADITGNVKFLNITEIEITKWANCIIQNYHQKNIRNKIQTNDKKIKKYDINESIKQLEKLYIDLIKEKR